MNNEKSFESYMKENFPKLLDAMFEAKASNNKRYIAQTVQKVSEFQTGLLHYVKTVEVAQILFDSISPKIVSGLHSGAYNEEMELKKFVPIKSTG